MIDFDYTNVRKKVIGFEHGIDTDFEFENYEQKMSEKISYIYEKINMFNAANNYNSDFIKDIKEYSDTVIKKFEKVIVIGMGSPILGIQAVYEALSEVDKVHNVPDLQFLNSIDPINIKKLSSEGSLKKTLVIIISKNGSEPEIMSLFMILKHQLDYEIGENYRMHIVACTTYGSLLHQIADQEGYKCFILPDERIGNYEILTTCGMLPLEISGINTTEFLTGARDAIEISKDTKVKTNLAAKMALIDFLAFIQKKKTISVIMSYSERLKKIADWCSHYKAELLAKDYDKFGNYISAGQVPYNAYGCSDQHALLQMFIEGNNNKIITFLRVKEFNSDCIIPDDYTYTAIGYLGGKTLGQLVNAEIDSMKMILRDYKRPNVTISLPKITPYYIGQLMTFYMLNIVMQSALYNVDTEEKQGAENLQNYICAQMGRYGYEETLREMQEKINKTMTLQVLPE